MIKRISITLFSLFLTILILATPVLGKDSGKQNNGVPFQELWEAITALQQQVEVALDQLQLQIDDIISGLQQQIDGIQSDLAGLQEQVNNIPPRYTDAEAVAAMGELGDDNTLNHNRYTDGEAVAAMGELGDDNTLNHNRYTDGEVVAAMGELGDDNALNHNRYTDEEAIAALDFHTSDTDIHYTGDDLTRTRISYGEWTMSSHTHVMSNGALRKIPFDQHNIGLLPGFDTATSVFTAPVDGVYNINALLFTSSDPPNENLREVSIVINNDRFNGPALYLPPIADYDHPFYINWTGALRQDDEVYIALKQVGEEAEESEESEESEEEEEYLTISSAGTKLCITKLSNLDLSKVKEEESESSEEESEEKEKS